MAAIPDAGTIDRWLCMCDVRSCPREPYRDWDDRRGREPCLIETPATECSDALRDVCGRAPGLHGFCDAPTLDTESGIVCFTQPDGTHRCSCPGTDVLVDLAETNCNLALRAACRTECESEAGHCEPSGNGYQCDCAVGLSETSQAYLCQDALRHLCEPSCENDAGACYWHSGGERISCRCEGDAELTTTDRDPNGRGDECLTPLARLCGEL